MPLQGLTIERMCQLAQVNRAGFYRWLQEPQPVEAEMEVRSAIQQIAQLFTSFRKCMKTNVRLSVAIARADLGGEGGAECR